MWFLDSCCDKKEKMKKYNDQKIEKHDFLVGDLVLLFNSRLRLFASKLKSKWTSPFLVTHVFPHAAVELENKKGVRLKVNGQRIKIFLGHAENANETVRHTISMMYEYSIVLHPALMLNQALIGTPPNMYLLANNRFFLIL